MTVGSDTEKIKEVKKNREFCDDRYVTWRWMIIAICGFIAVVSSLGFGFGRWGAGVDRDLAAGKSFQLQYQSEISILRGTILSVRENTDTLKTILREKRR